MQHLWVGILLVVTLAACAQAPFTPPAPNVAPTQAAKQGVAPLPNDLLVEYLRTGCMAGVKELLTVYTDGRLELISRGGPARQGQVTAGELAVLTALLADPAYAGLASNYQATGADLCIYTITSAGPDGAPRTVVTMDAAQAPAILDRVLAELQRLRGQVK